MFRVRVRVRTSDLTLIDPTLSYLLKLHEGVRKAESSLAIQLRTGTNCLDAFLFKDRVTFVSSQIYSCGRGRQMATHIIIFSPRHARA